MTLSPESTPAEIAAELRELADAPLKERQRVYDMRPLADAIDPPPRMVTLTVRDDEALCNAADSWWTRTRGDTYAPPMRRLRAWLDDEHTRLAVDLAAAGLQPCAVCDSQRVMTARPADQHDAPPVVVPCPACALPEQIGQTR